MGNLLASQAEEVLGMVLEKGDSKATVRADSTTYTASQRTLRPIPLGDGLHLTGGIDMIGVSTKTLAAAAFGLFGALLGAPVASPPLHVEARGLRLCISAADAGDSGIRAEHKTERAQGSSGRSSLRPEELKQHLNNMTVDVQDVAIELKLGGHRILASAQSLRAKSEKPGRMLAKWQVQHSGIRVELDGRAVVRASDAHASVQLAEGLRRVDVSTETNIQATLDVEQLLAVLDLAAVAAAIAEAEQLGDKLGEAYAKHPAPPFELRSNGACLRLDQFSDAPLLEANCKEFRCSSLPGANVEIRAEPLEVRQGGAPAVASQKMLIKVESEQKAFSIQHGFPAGRDGAMIQPWRGTLDYLLDDPRFAQHKGWLARARDTGSVAARKHPRDEVSGSTGVDQKRLRL